MTLEAFLGVQSFSELCQKACPQSKEECDCLWQLQSKYPQSEAADQLMRANGEAPCEFELPTQFNPCIEAIQAALTAWCRAGQAVQSLSTELAAKCAAELAADPALQITPSNKQRAAIVDAYVAVHEHICAAISSVQQLNSKQSGKWYSLERIAGDLLFWSRGADQGVELQTDNTTDVLASDEEPRHSDAPTANIGQQTCRSQSEASAAQPLQPAQPADPQNTGPRYLRICLKCQAVFPSVSKHMVNGHALSRHIQRMSLPLTKAQFDDNYSDPDWAQENYGALATYQLDGSPANMHHGEGCMFCRNCDAR